jgi:DNA repair exonuclease SbcCD ATPase subunit
MDAKQAQLEKKLEDLLKQTAEVSAQLQSIEQGTGVPHYDEIEGSAHDLGQRLSRLAQVNRTREIAAEIPPKLDCPDCGKPCPVEAANREVSSVDGRLELTENVAHCRRCRRSFFPST